MSQTDVHIEIAEADQASIADALSQLLADSYTLHLKTNNYHWNVTGPHFGALHALFEVQYTDLALAVDSVAERIRALGRRAPGSYAEFSARTEVVEATIEPTKAMEMVAALATDHQPSCRPSRLGGQRRRRRTDSRPGHDTSRGP